MTVESCSGPHERTLLDNVCGCNFLRGEEEKEEEEDVQNKAAKQNVCTGSSHRE